MKRTKTLVIFAGSFWLTVAQADSWSWLDRPEEQEWSHITIKGYERQISFDIPDKRKRGRSVIRVPGLEKGKKDHVIEVYRSELFKRNNRSIGFDWERSWRGFFEGDVTDYSLRIQVTYVEGQRNFLSSTTEERIDSIRDNFWNEYSHPDAINSREFFFERFKIEPYQSQQSYVWTLENKPTVVKEQEYFRLPFTDNRELIFWFYYRWETHGGNDDTAWLERRRALSRKILDTVRIEPDPYQ